MARNMGFSGRRSSALLMGAVVLVLAACAQVGGGAPTKAGAKQKGPQLVFPEPPEEPRFHYEFPIFGSGSIVPITEEQQLQELLTGTSDRSDEPFSKPYSIAVWRGKVFVSDTVGRSVRVFDVPKGKATNIGGKDEENPKAVLTKPMGVDVDDAGNLYVADATEKVVKVYDQTGKYLRTMLKPEDFDKMASVTVDKNGERMYIVDIGGPSSQNHRVRVYNAQTGDFLFDIGKRGSAPGELNLPRDVAVSANGEIYVVDGGNFRIQIFDHDGKFLRMFGSVGKQLGSFSRPKEIALDSDGNVYVVDAAFGNFQIFNPQGELLLFIGDRSNFDGPALYMLPSGIAVDEDNRVYVVDQWFRKVDVFRPAALAAGQGYTVRKRRK